MKHLSTRCLECYRRISDAHDHELAGTILVNGTREMSFKLQDNRHICGESGELPAGSNHRCRACVDLLKTAERGLTDLPEKYYRTKILAGEHICP